ncbi:MAG: Modification methylase TaqI [Elusimicrobia bacterium ADurb.Bin231]|nr:MAG: Modification methylase TaqI [Elusimicrobia bacterium ADurb.Bin231]
MIKVPKKQKKYLQKKKNYLLIKENNLVDYKLHQDIVNNNLKGVKKDYGMFFTPERIVDFMVNLIDMDRLEKKNNVNILEPACGLAQFLIGIKKNHSSFYRKARPIGLEVNKDIINYLINLKVTGDIKLIHSDYLLWESSQKFDLIIGNPPYGIPSLSKHYTIKIDNVTKDKYKNIYETWYGKYNMYGAFIEKSIKLLKPEGQLIFIIPATFMILDEFKKLRSFLSRNGRVQIIYLGPDVFKPEADVASVVIDFRADDKSGELKLLEYKDNKLVLIKGMPHWEGEVIKFATEYTIKLENVCSYLLGDIYDINISQRTPEIKNNPFIITGSYNKNNTYLPLLNGRNLKCNKIIYDNFTGYWIKKSDAKKLRGYFSIPHIVVGLGFRENGKVAAAIDERSYPWMGDIYHLLRKNELFVTAFDLSDLELLEYLNSDYIRKYIKDTYREITYHLSITQLKNIPLPTKKEWLEIKRKGINRHDETK